MIYAQQMVDFAKDRPGWRIGQMGLGLFCAHRTVEFLSQSYELRLYPSAIEQDHWVAVVISSANEKVADYDGTYDEVTAQISRTEKTLDLVGDLSTCRTREDALRLVENVRGRHLELLRRAVGVPRGSADRMRRAIVNQTCGFRIDSDVILNGKW